MAKRLIVNADDYGSTRGLSRGILESHRQGIVTSTSVMVGSPSSKPAIAEALLTTPQLGLGLHLTISGRGNRPVLPPEQVPSLVQPDGTFYPFSTWFTHYGDFSIDEIVQEYAAQYAQFVSLAGKAPDHLDAHHHMAYRHPAILAVLFDLADRHRLPVRNAGYDDAGLAELVSVVPDRYRVESLSAIKQILAHTTPAHPDYFVSSFYSKTATLDDLLLSLSRLPDGTTEIMCHPGYVDSALISEYTVMREVELSVLTHKEVRAAIDAHHIELINFGALQA